MSNVFRCDCPDEEGDFDHAYHCKLWSLCDPSDWDLFYPTPEWRRSRTRAKFSMEQMGGGCAGHRYYGKVRIFRWRGMTMQLGISDYRQPDLRQILKEEVPASFSFALTVDVRLSPEARNRYVGPAP